MSAQPVAFITGASRGIGRAFALRAAQEGYHVVALARTAGGLEDLDDEIKAATGQSATLMAEDLSRPAELSKLGYGLFQRFGRLDLFAGIAAHASSLTPTWQADPSDFARALAVNVQANQVLIRTLHPLLVNAPNGGRVLFASGGAPELGRPFWTAYAASKAALATLAETYAQEMIKQPLSVTLANPGPTATALRKVFYPGEDQAEALASGKLNSPEQAAAKLWIAVSGGDDPTKD